MNDEIREIVANGLVDACYGLLTSKFIDERGAELTISDNDRHRLDLFLSIIGFAAALRAIELRYDAGAVPFAEEVLSQLDSRLAKAGAGEEIINVQKELVRQSWEVLQSHVGETSQSPMMWIGRDLLAAAGEVFEDLDVESSSVQLWLYDFVDNAIRLANVVLDNAEKEHGFHPEG